MHLMVIHSSTPIQSLDLIYVNASSENGIELQRYHFRELIQFSYVPHSESFQIEEILESLVASSLRRKFTKKCFPFAGFVDFLIRLRTHSFVMTMDLIRATYDLLKTILTATIFTKNICWLSAFHSKCYPCTLFLSKTASKTRLFCV